MRRLPVLRVAPLAGLVAATLLFPPSLALAQEGNTYAGDIVDEAAHRTAACFFFSDEAPGTLTVVKEVGTDDVMAWAHTNHNRSKKWFMGTGTPGIDAAIAVFGKVVGGGKRIRVDAIDELGGTFQFRGTRVADCPLP